MSTEFRDLFHKLARQFEASLENDSADLSQSSDYLEAPPREFRLLDLPPELITIILGNLTPSSLFNFALTNKSSYALSVLPLNRCIHITRNNLGFFRVRVANGSPFNDLVQTIKFGNADWPRDTQLWNIQPTFDMLRGFPNLKAIRTCAYYHVTGWDGINQLGHVVWHQIRELRVRVVFPKELQKPQTVFPHVVILDIFLACHPEERGVEYLPPDFSRFFPSLSDFTLRMYCGQTRISDEHTIFKLFRDSTFPFLHKFHLIIQDSHLTIGTSSVKAIAAFLHNHPRLEELSLPSWIPPTSTFNTSLSLRLRTVKTSLALAWLLGTWLGKCVESIVEISFDGIRGINGWERLPRNNDDSGTRLVFPYPNVRKMSITPKTYSSITFRYVPDVFPNVEEISVDATGTHDNGSTLQLWSDGAAGIFRRWTHLRKYTVYRKSLTTYPIRKFRRGKTANNGKVTILYKEEKGSLIDPFWTYT